MDVKKSKITYPKSVLAMYLKLFCRRRNSDKHKMLQGIQSWLTLSKSEKQKFYNKYKECRLNHKLKLANYLIKVKPYLKKKNITRKQADTWKRSEEPKLETSEKVINDSEAHLSYLDCDRTEHIDANEHNGISNYNSEPLLSPDHHNESTSLSNEPVIPVPAEPAPPSVRTGKELFVMLKATSADLNNKSWAMLPNVQKSRYQRAVQLLKNDYIQKYKTYLESLPSKDLFNCYNSFFD